MLIELTGKVSEAEKEDGGSALICNVCEDTVADVEDDEEFFVRLQSWNEEPVPFNEKHVLLKSLAGKRVKISIEVID